MIGTMGLCDHDRALPMPTDECSDVPTDVPMLPKECLDAPTILLPWLLKVCKGFPYP